MSCAEIEPAIASVSVSCCGSLRVYHFSPFVFRLQVTFVFKSAHFIILVQINSDKLSCCDVMMTSNISSLEQKYRITWNLFLTVLRNKRLYWLANFKLVIAYFCARVGMYNIIMYVNNSTSISFFNISAYTHTHMRHFDIIMVCTVVSSNLTPIQNVGFICAIDKIKCCNSLVVVLIYVSCTRSVLEYSLYHWEEDDFLFISLRLN